MRSIVVVGAGLAGFRAAQALRSHGFDGELTIIGDERHRPYDRPPLSKQLLSGAYTREQCFLPGEVEDVNWLLGQPAVHLDRARRVVSLADGTGVDYDGLIIATGRRARPWPGPAPATGVLVLRSLDDVERLRDAVDADSRLVIIGAASSDAKWRRPCASATSTSPWSTCAPTRCRPSDPRSANAPCACTPPTA